MGLSEARHGRKRRAATPLDETRLRDLALAYVARFATTSTKLERYLRRKLRERGWAGEDEPDVAALAQRYVELGYIDDEAYARSKSAGLLRRGYGPRRVAQALGEAGIDADMREDLQPGEADRRRAAVALARKRRFGPFAVEAPDPARREKQFAAMVRAGHGFDAARTVLDAPGEDALDEWIDEALAEEEFE